MTRGAPIISAVVCTYNRADRLQRSLESVLSQDMAPDLAEVIVVDNGSTDETRSVVEQFASRVTAIVEPCLGLSHARNAGWRAARGDYIALIDDDAVAPPQWLSRIVESFVTVRPEPACVGGRVTPSWEGHRPDWLSDRLLSSLSVADWPAPAHAIIDLGREWLVGTNMAVRRDVLERFGGFSPALGRRGQQLISGEEIYLQRKLIAAGLTCWYEPRAVVTHAIPASRMKRRWFRSRYYAQGYSDATMWRLEGSGTWRGRIGAAVRESVRVARASAGPGRWIGSSDDASLIEGQCDTAWRLGFIAGLLAA